MKRPGLIAPSAFGSSARTVIERVTGSMRESSVVSVPLKLRSPNPSARASIGSPG